jgi:radical SAM superfamily enzyme YgiQ (UPF0313 family)
VRITFVYPNIGAGGGAGGFLPRGRLEPLVFALLAALTPKDVELRFHDDRLEPVPLDEPTDLVGISVETYSARRAYEIADAYRARGVRVVLGGYQPTVLPDEAAAHADAVVVGEAEGLWPGLVEDARRGMLQPRYRGEGRVDMSGVRPRREIFRGRRYLPIALVHFGRGCTSGCSFCALSAFYAPRYNRRPVADALADAAAVRGRFVFFADDNIAADREAAARLFEGLVPLRLRWAAQVSVDHLVDEPFVRLMARAGCRGVLVGFESLAAEALAAVGKRANRPQDYAAAVANLQRHGMVLWSSFLLGFDTDGPEVFRQTVDFAVGARSCVAAFNPISPYPGTALHAALAQQGRLRFGGSWWLDPAYRFGDVPFVPARMSPEALAEGCMAARRRFTSLPSLLRRALNPRVLLRRPSLAAWYLAANRISRRDAFAKHRMQLGSA